MSFSSDVKIELSALGFAARHCSISEISAFLANAKIDDDFTITLVYESSAIARRFYSLLKTTFNYEIDINTSKINHLSKKRFYTLKMNNLSENKKILKTTGLLNSNEELSHTIDGLVVQKMCCKRAYIRAAFLSIVYLSNPNKSYHLEFVCNNLGYANELIKLLNEFDLDAKLVKRKNSFVVYLKEAEKIVKVLSIVSAHKALLEFENILILKDIRNNVNRGLNFELANINKSLKASLKQIDDIEIIKNSRGLDSLSLAQKEIALLRMEYPEDSLNELGKKLNPAISKSGVNHRLRKISQIADMIKTSKEVK